jgi:four helix bundle protein
MDTRIDAVTLKNRTKQFALRVVKLYQSLSKSGEEQVIGKQLLRSATSVGANYRAACRARSDNEFLSKISIVIEEADESEFWIELLIESNIIPKERLADLLQEAEEIVKIMVSSRQTVKHKIEKAQSKIDNQQ